MPQNSAAANPNQRQTNIELVTDIMDFSRYGALAQAFVISALEAYSQEVLASTSDGPAEEVQFVPLEVWKGIASEVLQKLSDRDYVTKG